MFDTKSIITLENASPEVYRNWRDWCATISPMDPNQFGAEDFADWVKDGMPCMRTILCD